MSIIKERVVVAGACGFIGGHLVADLIGDGYTNVAVDEKSWHVPVRSPELTGTVN